MRLNIDSVLLFAAPLTALAAGMAVGGITYASGVAVGAALGVGLSYFIVKRGVRRLSPYVLVLILWFVLAFLSLVINSFLLAGISLSVLVFGFLALQFLSEQGMAASIASFIIAYVVSESLLEAVVAYGFPAWYYLVCLVNVRIYWWLTPPLPVRIGFAVSAAFIVFKYVLVHADTRLRGRLTYALVGIAGAWSLIAAILVSSTTFTDSPYVALLAVLTPLLLLTFLSR